MTGVAIIADVHISPITVRSLQAKGWDIIRSTDVLPANAPDQTILDYARAENRVVLTQDLDFSMLVALSGHSHPSLITLRLSSASPSCVNQRLLDVLPQILTALQAGSAITVDDKTVRIRQLPIR